MVDHSPTPKDPITEIEFESIYKIIQDSRFHAQKKVNQILIKLYWEVGKTISQKVKTTDWGKSTVQKLSNYIHSNEPNTKGFSARNIWRMKQFYETYSEHTKLSTVLTEISWSNHLHILSKSTSDEEREFYLTLTAKNNYSARTLARLIDTGTFERTMLANEKLSTALTEFPADTKDVFKDVYLFEFTGLQDDQKYKEFDLQKRLLQNLKEFLLEMGPDFSFIGEEYLVQVGNKDYKIDLLLHHRGLNCLICCELKIDDFKPEYLGKLEFYLEALDQTVKKPHENPSIGLLISKNKDDEVVKFAMNRNMSPALVAEYKTQLLDKPTLQRKLLELSNSIEEESQKPSLSQKKRINNGC